MKVAIYARYSSDNQRDASIADQLRVCIRALVEAIVLDPDGEQLITLKGDLAGMLNAARDSKRSPDSGDVLVQIKLVCGGVQPAVLAAVERRGVRRPVEGWNALSG